jgi:SIR2-like domain
LTEEIKPIPDLPAGLREAATRGRLIPFVGAGASRIAGCPTWVEFANAALRSLVALGNFSYAQLDQIHDLSPRIKMSIALSLAKEKALELNFEKIPYPFGARESQKGQRLYAALSKLGKTFVTTNYDEWLDKAMDIPAPSIVSVSGPSQTAQPSRTVIYKVDDLIFDNLSRQDTVIHLHGSLREPEGTILTTPQYLKKRLH